MSIVTTKKKCAKCSNLFTVLPNRKKYCSISCCYADRGGSISYYCMECGKVKTVRRAIFLKAKNHFCSVTCSGTFYGRIHQKDKHWNWKGGIAKNHRRENQEYKEWRVAVYKRDNWSCQHCGVKTRAIVAHHIKPYNTYPFMRYEISNGQTLCRSCHKKVHSEIGYGTRFSPTLSTLAVTHKIIVS